MAAKRGGLPRLVVKAHHYRYVTCHNTATYSICVIHQTARFRVRFGAERSDWVDKLQNVTKAIYRNSHPTPCAWFFRCLRNQVPLFYSRGLIVPEKPLNVADWPRVWRLQIITCRHWDFQVYRSSSCGRKMYHMFMKYLFCSRRPNNNNRQDDWCIP